MSIFITRHLERMDYQYNNASEGHISLWNKHKSEDEYFILNPYITDTINHKIIDEEIKKLPKIDIIITSPFLRCMQTSLFYAKKINYDKPIHVHFDLGDIYNLQSLRLYETNLIRYPINLYKIYNHSLHHIHGDKDKFIMDNDTNNIIQKEETFDEYYIRLKCTIKSIIAKYKNQNILIVSHAYSIVPFNENKERMVYNKIYEITNNIFKKKYMKYKNKYVNLKIEK